VGRRRPRATLTYHALAERCWVAMKPLAACRVICRALYHVVDALPSGAAPIRIRLIDGGHPEVEVNVVTRTREAMMERTVRLPRHREGSLERGFCESDLAGDTWRS